MKMNEKDFEFILKTGESFFAEFKEGVDKSLAKELLPFPILRVVKFLLE
jgi:hypothetical protein